MPRIPQAVANRQLTTQSPNRLVDAASFKDTSRTGEMLSEAGKTLAAVGEHFEKVRDLQQTTTAQTAAAKRLNEIYLKTVEDPDIWNSGKKAAEEMAGIKSELSATITNQLERDKFEASFDIDAMNYTNKINATLRTKQHAQVSADALLYIDTKKEEYFASSYAGQAMIKSQIKEKYGEMAKLGVWSADTAYKEFKKTESDMRTGQVDFDADRDLQGTLDELKKGKDGFYPDLTTDERSALIDSVGKKIRRDQLISAFEDGRQKDQNEAKTLVAWADGTLTEQELKDGLSNMEIRRPFAEKMFNKLYSDPNVKTDYGAYIKIRGMQLSGNSAGEINQAILDNGDKLSKEDKKGLIDKTFSETDKQQKEKIKYNVDALKIWSIRNLSTPKNDLSSDVIYEFHRRVNTESAQGTRIDEIAQEVIKDKIKENIPSTALMSDVPNFVAERNKIRKVYEKNSKLKGKAPAPKSSAVTGGNGIDFDDL